MKKKYYIEFNHQEYNCSQGTEIECLESEKDEMIGSCESYYIRELLTYNLPLSFTKEVTELF